MKGWDLLRAERYRRMKEMGIIEKEAEGDYNFDLGEIEENEIKTRLSEFGYLNE